jgi:RHS repeat-associated protein
VAIPLRLLRGESTTTYASSKLNRVGRRAARYDSGLSAHKCNRPAHKRPTPHRIAHERIACSRSRCGNSTPFTKLFPLPPVNPCQHPNSLPFAAPAPSPEHNHARYDAENRLIQVDGTVGTCSTATACYTYDAGGLRVEKTTSAGELDYLYDLSGNDVTIWLTNTGGSSWLTGNVYFNGGLAAEYYGGTTYFVHQDHLGSTRLVTALNQSIAQNLDYLPFGELNSADSGITTHEFTGDELDSETNLDHTWFRKYASSNARWITPDPAGLAAVDPTNPQSWNRYSYVLNTPLTLIDPLGACPGGTAQYRDANQQQESKVGGPFETDWEGDPWQGQPDQRPFGPCPGFTDQGGGGVGVDPFFGPDGNSIYNQPLVGLGEFTFGYPGGNGFLFPGTGGGGPGPFGPPILVGLTYTCTDFFNDGAGFFVSMGGCDGAGCTVNGQPGICATSAARFDSGGSGGGNRSDTTITATPTLKFKPPSLKNFTFDFLPCYGSALLGSFLGNDSKAGATAGTIALFWKRPKLGGPLLAIWSTVAAFNAGSACAVASRGYYQ